MWAWIVALVAALNLGQPESTARSSLVLQVGRYRRRSFSIDIISHHIHVRFASPHNVHPVCTYLYLLNLQLVHLVDSEIFSLLSLVLCTLMRLQLFCDRGVHALIGGFFRQQEEMTAWLKAHLKEEFDPEYPCSGLNTQVAVLRVNMTGVAMSDNVASVNDSD